MGKHDKHEEVKFSWQPMPDEYYKARIKTLEKRIEELALTLPECPVPLAAYVPATRFGDTIVVSGQLPSVKGNFSAYCGTVPSELPVEKATEAARICLLNNIAAAIRAVRKRFP